MIRAVLFDADGVLQSSPKFLATVAAFVPQQHREAFGQAVFAAEQPCLTGNANFGERLLAVLREWELEASYERFLQVFHDIQIDHDVLRHVEAVRDSGVKCCVASNQQAVRASHMSTALGYAKCFDREFYSHALGVAKPDSQYFRHILTALSLPPEQILFIDDSMPNVRAASDVGLRGEHFPSNSGGQRMGALLRQYGIRAA